MLGKLLEFLIVLTCCHLLWARFILNRDYYNADDPAMLDYQSNYHLQPTGYTNEYGYGFEYGYNPQHVSSHRMYQFSRSMPFKYNSPGSYYDEWRKVHRPLPGGGSCILVNYYKQCSEGFIGLKSHPTLQQYYYICKPNQIILGKCLHSQIFNITMGQCVRQVNLEYEPTCTSYGIYPILYNCKLYYRCDRNLQYRLYNCPNDMIFSLTQRRCVQDDKCIPTQIASNETQLPDNLESKFPPCTKPGIHRSPDDCSQYFKCDIQPNGIYLQTRFKCPTEMFYDVNTNQCLPQGDLDCLQIDAESMDTLNHQESNKNEEAPFSEEETEDSGSGEPLITTDKSMQDENSLSTTTDQKLIILPTYSDVDVTELTTERLYPLTTQNAEINTTPFNYDQKLNASDDEYTNKMAMKKRGMAFLDNFDSSTDITSDSIVMNNEIDNYTTELSDSTPAELSEENLIAVTEAAFNNQTAKEALGQSTIHTTTTIESCTELCTKSTTDLPTQESPTEIPHLEIIAKQPLDLHLSFLPNRTHKQRNDFKDNQMVLLRWFSNASNKTFSF